MKAETSTAHGKGSLLKSADGQPLIIAGPCSAETEEQVMETALRIKAQTNARIFRAGIWKPRTRPGSFEGIGKEGLPWLQKVQKLTGMPVAVEVASAKHVQEALAHGVDILWVGARTTVNPFSVQEVADALRGVDIPVLVKNPLNPDLSLWIGAMERLAQAGIHDLGAIHRGFSTNENTNLRNTPKWNLALKFRKQMPEIPLICDPSHIGGKRSVLQELSQKALDLGMDGLMIESHITPDTALSDASQQVTPEALAELLSGLQLNKTAAQGCERELLDELHGRINSLDNELLELLSFRAQISGKIGQFKKSQNSAAMQAHVWDGMSKLLGKAQTEGLEETFIQSIFSMVNDYSVKIQEQELNNVNPV
jgi:chorismate mutase